MKGKITSISSATGWWVGYGDAVNSEQMNFHRVVAFALCETKDGQSVEAVDTVDFAEGIGSLASDSENYRGLFHDDEFEILGEKLIPSAQSRFDRGPE
ncbi:hypothetical protein K4K96_08660 [Phaeobacter inhibens]|uniref:hypothetical protein n=1 Tax=Phaeobacter inhibens TaxID=221822 RepID=UPI0021A5B3C3|nr:hypothetical protein [Phaeobacter inhibens]UWR90804.1 hypothetical protein K4K96_08660 [Phaeobacter inhibens]